MDTLCHVLSLDTVCFYFLTCHKTLRCQRDQMIHGHKSSTTPTWRRASTLTNHACPTRRSSSIILQTGYITYQHFRNGTVCLIMALLWVYNVFIHLAYLYCAFCLILPQVEYQCEGFLEKNKDTVNEEQINVLKSSKVCPSQKQWKILHLRFDL